MRTTIEKAGRVVIPAPIRERAGLTPGAELEMIDDDHRLRTPERAQSLLHAIAEKRIASPATAWHGCLEFFSVAMRLPPEDRLAPADAGRLLEEIFARMSVHDLPAGERASMPQTAARDAITGGGFTLPTSPRSLVRLAPRLWSRTTGGSSYWRCATTCVSRPRPNISIP